MHILNDFVSLNIYNRFITSKMSRTAVAWSTG